MPSLTSPTASHFHPYRQVPTFAQSGLSYFKHHPSTYDTTPYWVWTPAPESKPKSTRTRRYSVGCSQPSTEYISQGLRLDTQHKVIYYAEPVRSPRARRASRSQIYEAPRHLPPTPWLRTVPLPHAEDSFVAPPSYKGHSRTASIDSSGSGSWSPEPSFLQKYASLPRCVDDTAHLKAFQKVVGPLLNPELAKENRLKWDVRNLPHGASFSLPGAAFARPDLNVPALSSEIRSVSISFDAPRAELFRKDWGCIVVRARSSALASQDAKMQKNTADRCYELITVLDLMQAVFKYFNERLSAGEIAQSSYSSEEALLKRIGAARLVYTGHSKEGDRYRRVDLLDEFRFRSLSVDTTSGDWCHLHLRLK